VKKIYFVMGRLEQPRQYKKLLDQLNEPNEPTKEGPLSYVLLESPFASVSTVSRDHPSLVSLVQLQSHCRKIQNIYIKETEESPVESRQTLVTRNLENKQKTWQFDTMPESFLKLTEEHRKWSQKMCTFLHLQQPWECCKTM
jgi:hypothetical protein